MIFSSLCPLLELTAVSCSLWPQNWNISDMPGKHLNSSSFQTISKPHFCWSNLLGRPHFLWVTWPRFPNTWSVASHVARSAAGHWNCFAAAGVTGWSPVTSLPGSTCLGNPLLAQMEGLTRHDSTAFLSAFFSAFLFGQTCFFLNGSLILWKASGFWC